MKRYSEKREKALALRSEGKTYREIAKILDVSYQRVGQLIGEYNKKHFRYHSEKNVVYKKLRIWMNENIITTAELSGKMFGCRDAYFQLRLAGLLRGENNFKKSEIDKLLQVTGLTYEDCFGS